MLCVTGLADPELGYAICYKKTLRVHPVNRHVQILVREVPGGGDQREPCEVEPLLQWRLYEYGAKRTPEGTDPAQFIGEGHAQKIKKRLPIQNRRNLIPLGTEQANHPFLSAQMTCADGKKGGAQLHLLCHEWNPIHVPLTE